MLRRVPFVCLVALTLTMGMMGCQSTPEGKQATDKGKAVELGVEKLTMTDTEGKTPHSYAMSPDVVVTCAGKPCSLPDVSKDDLITVTTSTQGDKTVATKIEAEKAAS